MIMFLTNRRPFLVAMLLCLGANINPAHAFDLRGVVMDYTGRIPVADARVWVSHERQVFTARSNVEGQFHIENIEAGKIEIVALKPGHALGGKEGQLLGDDFVTVTLDKARDLPMRIIDSNYEPVNGARLKRMRINELFTVNVEDLIPHGYPSVRSNSEGIMNIPHMPKFGFASMSVTHSDYAEGVLPTFPVGRESNMTIVMVDGIKLRGRVTNEAGSGVARARVAIARSEGGQNLTFTEALTDSDGFYSISVPPAKYLVAAKHEDHAVSAPVSIRLRAGLQEAIVDVQLLTSYRILGQAVLESGDPVALVQIAYRNSSGAIAAQTFSGRGGQYEINVPSGIGTLLITPPKGMMTVNFHEIPVDIQDSGDVTAPDISLRPLPAITGTVTDRKGNPVPQAFVRTIDADPPILTQSNEEGRFRIQLDSVRGVSSIQLYAEHPYRFTRAVNDVDLLNLEPQKLVLKSFHPKTKFMPELAVNNLSELFDEPAPEWSCSDWFNLPEGMESVSLADLKGKIVVLTFWAGFDLNGRTRQRLEQLSYLYEVFGQHDKIVFVTIHDGTLKPFEVELIVNQWKIPYPVGCDDEKFTSFSTYDVKQIPQTVIIGPDGKLKYYEVEGRLHTLIKAMLRK